MSPLTRRYVKTSFAFLGAGLVLGAYLIVSDYFVGASAPRLLITAHVHLLLVGFMVMLVMGVATWMFPRPAAGDTRYRPGVAEVVYWLVTVSTVSRALAEILTALGALGARPLIRRQRVGADRRCGPVRRQHLVADSHAVSGASMTAYLAGTSAPMTLLIPASGASPHSRTLSPEEEKDTMRRLGVTLIASIVAVALAGTTAPVLAQHGAPRATAQATQPPAGGAPKLSRKSPAAEYTPTVRFRLRTELAEGKMAFVGIGGEIEGVVNPTLRVAEGAVVQVGLINGDGIEHDVVFPSFNAATDRINRKGAASVTVFRAAKAGEFDYFCSLPGHQQAGMAGKLVVGGAKPPVTTALPGAVSIARDPADLPGPLTAGASRTTTVELEAVELVGKLANDTSYRYWTFNGKVPGPFVRVRVGDTVNLVFKNRADSRMIHSVDLHAVTGPGGGAVMTQTPPGETKSFRFKALNPGLFVYHCATPMVANHISSGMYGLILVEPAGGLPKVDREFYVMQGELYTDRGFGQRGHDEFSVEKLLAERAEYFVFNGAVGALTTEYPMKARVGETVRIFFGVGGPNATSSFHVIGEIFDRVYDQAAMGGAPATNVQTTAVPAGGATIVEFKLQVPGRYILVDHALARLERGLAGFLVVDGPEDASIFHGEGAASMAGH